MNKERLLELAAHLEAMPENESYDQNTFLEWDGYGPVNVKEAVSCGTPACIAGHAVALFGPEDLVRVSRIPDVAQGLLGLSDDTASELFTTRWPSPPTEEAAAVVRQLAETGVVNWEGYTL